jgi:coproporphyrinogen III oxidase-like Fe-S oxidoreductase
MIEGLSFASIQIKFGDAYLKHIKDKINTSLNKGHAILLNETIQLTTSGKLFADAIAADLFY